MPGGGELGHVRTGLGDDHVSLGRGHPRDAHQQLPDRYERDDHHLDPLGDVLDRGGVLVDQVQVGACQEGVLVAEAADQRLGQFRRHGAQLPLGQHRRVLFPGDQRLEHRPPGPQGSGHSAGVCVR